MRETTRRRIRRLLDSRKNRREFLGVFAFAAVALVLAVVTVLMQNGVAATYKQRVLDCYCSGVVAHSHDANCYDANGSLVCQLPEIEYHKHTDDCYVETYELVCGQEESEGHTHTDACFDEEGNVVCGLEESAGHTHTDACYKTDRVLVCGQDEVTVTHVHGQGCFKTIETEVPDPEPQEIEPQASEAASAAKGTQIAATIGANGEQQYAAQLKRTHEDGSEEVVLTVNVKAPRGAFPNGTTMGLGDVKPEQIERVVTDTAIKANKDVTKLTWFEGADIRFFDATGTEVEPSKKIEVKISQDRIRNVAEPLLIRILDDKAKTKYHKTDDAEILGKVVLANQSDDDKSTGNENSLKFETKLPTIYVVAEAVYSKGHVPQPLPKENEAQATDASEKTFTAEAGGVTVTAVAPAGSLPEGTDMVVSSVMNPSEYKSQVEATVSDEGTRIKDMAVVEVGFVDADGVPVEPSEQMSVSLASDIVADAEVATLVRVDEDPQVVAESASQSEPALSFEGEAAGTYALVGTETITAQVITASGKAFEISVTYGPEAGIPEGAKLQAKEIAAGAKKYNDYVAQAAEAMGALAADIDFARFFDVSIVASGEEVEPKTPVEVVIRDTGDTRPTEDSGLQIVHFADEGTEVIEPEVNADSTATTVAYTQGSFSVIGEVSTVKQNGFPTTNGDHVIVFQDGDDYYALKKDGTLTKVRYFNETVTFTGPGTTTTAYIDDYLWYVTSANNANSQGRICESNGGEMYLDPYDENMFSTAQRQLRVRDGKIYCNGELYGYSGYQQITLSASGGELHRVILADETASPVFFANASSFDANSNETDLFTQEEVDSIIAHWQKQMTQEMSVDKTAEVHDYDNRIYRVDVTASSADYEVSPSIALEFVVDASRSMFFPTSLDEVDTFNGGNAAGVRNWINSNGDHDQVYFVIQNKNGSATQYAIFWDSTGYWDNGWHDGQWRYVDASNYNPPDDTSNGGSANTRQEGRTLSSWNVDNLDDGKIYTTEITGSSSGSYGTRKTWVSRIEYLKQCVRVAAQVVYAVDENAQIGLIGFNKEITDYGTYGKQDQATFLSRVNNISLDGGTNSEGGLEKAIQKYDKVNNAAYYNEHYAGRKHVVVLVTDGAPNFTYSNYDATRTNPQAHAVTWDTIRNTADRLRNLKDDFGSFTELYTMGLSLKNVGTNQQGLFGIATDSSYCYAAEDAAQIINAVTKMVEGIFVQANLVGDVTDVIDQAFYPVDKATGSPLSAGDWVNLDGEKVEAGSDDAAGQISKSGENWVVKWTEQSIDWPTRDAQGYVEAPGWHGTVFVKAKEDFLGGNGVSTNATGSKVEASQYQVTGDTELHDLPTPSTSEFETPYVNVDELGLTRNNTEWTVYLGTEVDPLKEVKALWDKIKVIEVVTKTDDDHRVSSDGSMKYSYDPSAERTSDTSPVAGDEEFPLSSIVTLTDDNWATLLAGDMLTINYRAYGHTGGNITILLTQSFVEGEKNLMESPHATEVVGEAVEKYTLSVRYTPLTVNQQTSQQNITDWHTGSYGSGQRGNSASVVNSSNTHTINVYAKGLQITKVDLDDKPLPGAKFGLFRTARDGETDQDKLRTIDGKQYYQIAELDTSETGVSVKNPIEQLEENEQYYLVETTVPDGYLAIDPILVTLTLSDTYTPKPGTTTQTTKPESGIYDWVQGAVLTVDTSGGVVRTNADNTEVLTHNGIEASVTNEILYYRIPNTPGVELPKAGGHGVVDLYATGIAMIVGAATYLLLRRKRA